MFSFATEPTVNPGPGRFQDLWKYVLIELTKSHDSIGHEDKRRFFYTVIFSYNWNYNGFDEVMT